MDVGIFVTGALTNKNKEEELRLQQLAHEQKMKHERELFELEKERAEFKQQQEEKAFMLEEKKRKALLEAKKMEKELEDKRTVVVREGNSTSSHLPSSYPLCPCRHPPLLQRSSPM